MSGSGTGTAGLIPARQRLVYVRFAIIANWSLRAMLRSLMERQRPERRLLPATGLSLHDLPQRCIAVRQQLNLTQSELGMVLGVRTETISRWETQGAGARTALVVLALHCLAEVR